MQCTCAVLYRHLWPVRLYHISPHYLINVTILGGKLTEHKMCLDFLYDFCLKHESRWMKFLDRLVLVMGQLRWTMGNSTSWEADSSCLYEYWPDLFQAPSQSCEKLLLTSSSLAVRPSACNNAALTGRIFMKFDIWVFFKNLSRKFKFH